MSLAPNAFQQIFDSREKIREIVETENKVIANSKRKKRPENNNNSWKGKERIGRAKGIMEKQEKT